MSYRPKRVHRFNMVLSAAERELLRVLCERQQLDASNVIRRLIRDAAAQDSEQAA